MQSNEMQRLSATPGINIHASNYQRLNVKILRSFVIIVYGGIFLPIPVTHTQSCLLSSPNVKKRSQLHTYFCEVMTIEDILFDKDYLTISYKPEYKLIHMKWKGFASSENFRDGLTFIMETARDHQAENVLANLKLMQVILPQDEEWATQVWFPKLAQISLKKLGIVTSLDYFNNTSVKRMLNTAMPFINFETRYFVDVDQAREWLKSNQ